MCVEINIKEPKTFEEQLDILKTRKMIIESDERAIDILKKTNYYRLTAYALQFKENDNYNYNISFEVMYKLYQFDKKLRHLVLEVLENIEIALRTYMSYNLSIKYGAKALEKASIFRNSKLYNGYDDEIGKHHKGLIDEINVEINKNRKELFIKHHLQKYKGNFPIWVVIEIFSFGMLSKTYQNLNLCDQKSISRGCFNVNNKLLVSWLINLSYIRNICAHYGRLYNKKMTVKPKIHMKYNKDNFDKDRLFVSILAIKELSTNIDEWDSFYMKLSLLIDEYYEVIDLSLIGFPLDWKEILSRD